MGAEDDSAGSRWASPAGISALAAAAAVLLGAVGLVVQVALSPDDGPVQQDGPVAAATSLEAGAGTATGELEPEGSDPGPTGPEPGAGPTAVTPGEGGSGDDVVIPASCIGCTEDELAERQAHLNILTSRLAAPRSDDCDDTTETFTGGEALARIGCSFEGGTDVDFALWPDEAAMAQFTAASQAAPDAVATTWKLLGEEGPHTGTTVEYVRDGDAVFYWTYDEYLISGNAQQAGGDQARLNAWWTSTGAIMTERSE